MTRCNSETSKLMSKYPVLAELNPSLALYDGYTLKSSEKEGASEGLQVRYPLGTTVGF